MNLKTYCLLRLVKEAVVKDYKRYVYPFLERLRKTRGNDFITSQPIYNGYLFAVKYLIDEMKMEWHHDAVDWAAEKRNLEMLKYLIDEKKARFSYWTIYRSEKIDCFPEISDYLNQKFKECTNQYDAI